MFPCSPGMPSDLPRYWAPQNRGPEKHEIRVNSSKFLDFSGAGVETTGDGQVWVKFIEFHDFEVILPDSLSGSEIGHFQIYREFHTFPNKQ